MPTQALIEKYGAKWPADSDPLMIEFACIQRGGSWVGKLGQACGAGLFEHYMAARKLIWPHRYRHRWTDLMFKEFLQNEFTVLMGAASTQKTSHASEYALLKYWAFPNDTIVLVTTMTMEKLDHAIFAEIKMLFKEGLDRYQWLDGHVIDHRRCIATDDLEEEGTVRDLRCGIVGRPCFPSGTMVDTPHGPKPIESIQVGDEVVNAFGVGTVTQTHKTTADSLVRVKLSNGKHIDCTHEHPFLTQRGWIRAIDLKTFDVVFSVDETLSILRAGYRTGIPKQKVLQRVLQGPRTTEGLRFLRKDVQPSKQGNNREKIHREILLHNLCWKVGCEPQGMLSKGNKGMQDMWKADGGCSLPERILQCSLSQPASDNAVPVVREGVRFNPRISEEKAQHFLFFLLCMERDEASEASNWNRADTGRTCRVEAIPGIHLELQDISRDKESGWQAELVQNRHRFSIHQISGGNRRWCSPHTQFNQERCETHFSFGKTWVDSVEVLEPRSDPRINGCSGRYTVHNLAVAGHPSYSVENVIVHNCYVGKQYVGAGIFAGIKNRHVIFIADELQFCEPTFLAAADNLFSNDDVSIIASGNPQHNPDDQLGIAAEPIEGWNSLPEPTKTTTWQTRLYSGRCVNLVGTDSPNFDQPTDIYKGLIGRKFVKRIKEAHDEGEHSRQFYSQVKGVMRIDLAKDRVITRDICYRHHAMDQPIWSGKDRTKVYGIDPAYGGGDRCIAVWLEFGEGHDGKQILYIAGHREIPINLQRAMSAEDQIADGVAEDLVRLGIPTQNAFYDSFGKGTIGFAFARKFGSNSPIPVDSGGRTTSRPVRQDLLVWDDAKRQKRPKRCDEHYSKFVTEMWFSVRYAIEAEQVRGLPEPIMLEGCMREYKNVAGDKIEVEKKEDLRERLGRSPDLFDCLAVATEGARQRGFMIERLGTDKDVEEESDDYLAEEARNYQDVIKSKLLVRT